jgi:hypothetical protein
MESLVKFDKRYSRLHARWNRVERSSANTCTWDLTPIEIDSVFQISPLLASFQDIEVSGISKGNALTIFLIKFCRAGRPMVLKATA